MTVMMVMIIMIFDDIHGDNNNDGDDSDGDDVYLKLQREVFQKLWSEHMNNAEQPI
jgi:hypothetical protein